MKDLMLILDLYKSLGTKIHVLIRWFICPFNQMEKYIPKDGMVIDVGCGEGIFSIYLAIKSNRRKVLGVDLDRNRIQKARLASIGIDNIKFEVMNAAKINKSCKSIIISDAFHHFSKDDQMTFLRNSSKIIKKDGILLIKEINKDDFIRSKLSRIWDLVLYPRDEIRYWSRKNLQNQLIKLGFNVQTKRAALYFPGSTLLYICTKK